MFYVLHFRSYFLFLIVSLVVTLYIILIFELKILFEIDNIYGNYTAVFLFYVIWSMYSSNRMKTLIRRIMTRTSCLGTPKYIMFNIYLRRNELLLFFFRQFVELPAKNQPLLDYCWDISREWERLQGTTTLHERLYFHLE